MFCTTERKMERNMREEILDKPNMKQEYTGRNTRIN